MASKAFFAQSQWPVNQGNLKRILLPFHLCYEPLTVCIHRPLSWIWTSKWMAVSWMTLVIPNGKFAINIMWRSILPSLFYCMVAAHCSDNEILVMNPNCWSFLYYTSGIVIGMLAPFVFFLISSVSETTLLLYSTSFRSVSLWHFSAHLQWH